MEVGHHSIETLQISLKTDDTSSHPTLHLLHGLALLSGVAAASSGTSLDGTPGLLLPDASGLWVSPGGNESFMLSRHQPMYSAAAALNTVYRRDCDDGSSCGHCYITPVHDYDTRALQRLLLRCDGAHAASGVFIAGGNATSSLITLAGRNWSHQVKRTCPPGSGVYFPGEPACPGYRPGFNASQCLAVGCCVDAKLYPGRKAGWCFVTETPFPKPVIHTVHMIYMNHYDVGYTGFVNDVDNKYMHNYFKLAASTAREMKASNTSDRFIYTTHP